MVRYQQTYISNMVSGFEVPDTILIQYIEQYQDWYC